MKQTASLSDKDLIQLYINGEVDSLTVLINRYKEKIYTSIYLMVKDKYLAEDIFQDAFIKIIDSINNGRYKEDGKFSYWAMRIAHNLCMDHFRKIKTGPSIKSSGETDIFEIINSHESGHDEIMIRHQNHEKVRALLNRLPEDQKEVVIMRHYADLSFKEIAKLTDCSINTVLGRMRYALINIRKMVAERQMAF